MLYDLFKVPLWQCDGTPFLPESKEWFKNRELFKNTGPNYGNFNTSLVSYGPVINECRDLELVSDSFQSFLLQNAQEFLDSIGYDTTGIKLRITSLWMNEMVSNSFHNIHSHHGNILSGCFYVELPQNCAGISYESFLSRFDKVQMEIKENNLYNSPSWTVAPTEGTVFLWESYIKHFVQPSQFDGVRRTVAFDIGW